MADLKQPVESTKSIEEGKITNTFVSKRSKFVLNQCCFCIPLRVGCLVLAYLSLAGNVVGAVLGALSVASLAQIIQVYGRDALNYMLVKLMVLNSITLFLNVVSLIFNCFLLVGLHKEKRQFVKLYVIYQVVYLIVTVLINIVMIAMGLLNIYALLICIFGIVFCLYFILVIWSQYVKMGESISPVSTGELERVPTRDQKELAMGTP